MFSYSRPSLNFFVKKFLINRINFPSALHFHKKWKSKLYSGSHHLTSGSCVCTTLSVYNLTLRSNCHITNLIQNPSEDILNRSNVCEDLNFEILGPDVAALVENDPIIKEKVYTILKEYQFFKSKGIPVPIDLKSEHIIQMLEFDSRTRRRKYFKFVAKKEKLRLAREAKKITAAAIKEIKIVKSPNETKHINYGIGENSLFLRIQKDARRKFDYKRLANASLFGQKIVFDLDYDEHMWKKERVHCAHQLSIAVSANKKSQDPYDMYFCNAKPSYDCVKLLKKALPNNYNAEPLVDVTEKHYLDIFPKEKLVYLSPHASENLTHYDHNDIYIIGAFVDTVVNHPLSLAKAEKEGLRSYKLPIDEYIWWGHGCKSLAMNQIFDILLKMKTSGDWTEALGVVPKRKIRKFESSQLENNKNLTSKMYFIGTKKIRKKVS